MTVLLPSQLGFLLFLFLVWLLWLGLPISGWIKVVSVGIPVLFLILKEILPALIVEYGVSSGLVMYGLYYVEICSFYGLPWWLSGKEPTCQCRRCGSNPWVWKIPWRRKWQPTPIFLPRKSHGWRSLASYSSQGFKRVNHDLATKQHVHSISILLRVFIITGCQILSKVFPHLLRWFLLFNLLM